MSVEAEIQRWHEMIDQSNVPEAERERLHALLDEGVRRVRDLSRSVRTFEYAFFNPPDDDIERVEGARRAFERLRAANKDVEDLLNG